MTDIIEKETIKKVRKYLDNNGLTCPFCGSRNIHPNDQYIEASTFTAGELSVQSWCEDCKEEWIDIYRLTGITIIGVGNIEPFQRNFIKEQVSKETTKEILNDLGF